jgi:SulP family sulfate permease
MSRAVAVETHTPFVARDMADTVDPRGSYDEHGTARRDVVVYRITGALFFGATASIGSVLDRIQDAHRALVIDFAAVPFLDSTGANMIEGLARKAERRGVDVWLTGADRTARRTLLTHGLRPPHVRYAATIADALERIEAAEPEPPTA